MAGILTKDLHVRISAVSYTHLDVYKRQEVQDIVKENTEHKVLGIFGEERVNVLKCNLDIAGAMGLI